MGHSRIALATLLVLGLLTPAHGEQREPFFVELKGPDEPVRAAATPASAQPAAQPAATARGVAPATTTRSERYGPVRRSDTLWSLANRYRPSSRVSVYQTMVAIYEKNPRSFADGNINHILVGSSILLPTEQEARRISEAEAISRFRSDNASWKGISPKYQANRELGEVRNLTVHPKVASQPKSAPRNDAAPLPTKEQAKAPSASRAALPPAAPVKTEAAPSAALASTSAAVSSAVALAPAVSSAVVAPAPLPPQTATDLPGNATEMKLALDDTTNQLAQVSETNHRLKLRVESQTQELETLKAQLVDQAALQKEIGELKGKLQGQTPAAVPAATEKNWLVELLSSPLNLAMIILLPVLLVLALVTLWLRARARRELEEQEKSLSESTAAFFDDQDSHEFDDLLAPGVAPLVPEPPHREPAEPELSALQAQPDLVFHDESEPDAAVELTPSRDPDLVPEPQAVDEPESSPFTASAAPLSSELAEEVFDLSQLDAELDKVQAEAEAPQQAASDEAAPDVSQDDELALDFAEAFRESEAAPLPEREVAQQEQYVEIDALLADAGHGASSDEPYQNVSLDVGLDGFPEVLPESTGFDVDADDGGVGAKLDLARAYLEIDDKESARELLEEAAAQGSDSQRAEAEKLLKRLA
ncbi:FimV/HubP family polar landmark protein [Aeromonas simiae]|uniref:FimV/HubP family polar landmark protein n=1 Tax=Aeromonas simiae TaxID=218936 RepID=UPI0005A8D6ED|nr:FimV/HubP family polar landmark protein [Aeromonas simiae]